MPTQRVARMSVPAVILSGVPGLASAQAARRRLSWRCGALLATTALVAVTAFAPGAARAQDATWLSSPTSGNFNDAANWNPATVPIRTAFFGTSNTTALTFSASTDIGGWTFNAGASAYTFATNQLVEFLGAGIVVNGGSATININVAGNVEFFGTSTAGSATINDKYNMSFNNNSTAGNATITNGVSGDLRFDNFSTAGSATITNSNTVFFFQDSSPGDAAITNNSGGKVDFSGTDGPSRNDTLTAGSIAGGGLFLLGVNELTVGGNNLSTEVSGAILGANSSSLVKIGAGRLTLSGAATLGGTTVDAGTLAISGGTLNVTNTITVGSSAGTSGTLLIRAGGTATALQVAVGLSGTGALVIEAGGTLTDSGGFIGDLPGSRGTASVAGAGSTWTSADLQVGAAGTGTLVIGNGGRVNSSSGGSVGLSAGSTGTVTVTGPGSTWNNGPGGGLNIGSFGTGTLTIANGGMVINNTAFAADIGEGAGSQGTVTVTGPGSTWSNSSGVNIGTSGTGTLTIADGGIVTGPIVIATNAGAIGTLNIGAGPGDPAAAPGSLTAPSVVFGAGAGAINFNHTSANYVFASAISGAGSVNALAGVTILTANSTYVGVTTISAGALLQLGNGGTTGKILGNVTDNGTLAFNRSDVVNYSLRISGIGSLAQLGPGATNLSGASTYTGGTTISAGTLQLGIGGVSGSIVGDVVDNGVLAFDRSDTVTFPGVISGAGSVSQVGSGMTVLTGNNSYAGATTVAAGALFVDGDQSAATGATNVAAGATLGGVGVIGGNVSIANGGALAPGGVGGGIGTLTINGGLGLSSGSILNYSFGQAGAVGGPFNDLTVVNGDLTLAGTLNVALTPGGAFDPGVYRVISYAGALTDNGLLLGSVPPGTTEVVQTSVAHEVNLVNTTGVTLDYWDGAAAANKNNGLVDGGDGAWQNPAGNNNWTNVAGALNGSWADGVFAIFEAAPGTVTVDDSLGEVVASGMQFAVGGYTLTGDPITLVETEAGSGATVIRVGDGTAAGAGMTATIASVLQASTRLVKDDLGVLVLTGANTYSGGTTINAGTLQLGNGGASGGILGDVVDNGVLAFNRSDTVTFAGVISGGGAVAQIGSGTTILTGANTYAGGTTIGAGTLVAGVVAALGSGALTVLPNAAGPTTLDNTAGVTSLANAVILNPSATLTVAGSNPLTLTGVISGAGGLTKTGSSPLILTGDNTYAGGTTITAGTLQLGNGGVSGSIVGDLVDNGVLAFNRTDTVTFAGVISGAGSVTQAGSGVTVLTGNNSYGGATTVLAGALFVDGDQSAATGATTVAAGATLGGVGVIGGNVSVASGGTLAPGGAGGGIGTLTINGGLGLNSGSTLNYIFGQAGMAGGPFNDLTVVAGNLTLAGTLNVALTPGDVFEPGVYRVIAYAGALTDNGLSVGSVPPGTTEVVQTSVAHQVNLVNTTGVTVNYWDGAAAANKNNGLVDGGDGSWQNPAGNDNWTNVTGALNAPWANAEFAIFEAAPGTVTVDNSLGQVEASGLQFAVGGYTLTGGPITLVETEAGSGATVVRVGDGTTAGAGLTATIGSVLQGTTQLVKDDLGVLVLTGANTYTGGTTINAGTLQLGNGGTSGSILGDVTDNGVLAFNRSDTVTFAGVISGGGAVIQAGTGATILTGPNTYAGGTTIGAGTLVAGAVAALGSGALTVLPNAAGPTTLDNTAGITSLANAVILNPSANLTVAGSNSLTLTGVISGAGGLTKTGSSPLILTGDNTYTGGTTITAGTLQLGNGGATGGILGDVVDNGTLAFNRSDTVTFAGVISGGGAVAQIGSGTIILTGTNTYTGGTTISAGTLQLGNGGTTGGIVGDIVDNGVLAFNRSDTVTFAGVISGGGTVAQIGPGATILTGASSYTGGTTIAAGALQLGNGGTSGSLPGDVVDNGMLAFNRSDTATFAGVISGGGAVAQIGPGVTILTADSPFTGGATVTAGTLAVGDSAHPSAALSGGGPITVAQGGTLGGYGSVTGSVVNDGVIAAGNATPGLGASPTGAFTILGDLLNRGALRLASGASIGNVLEVGGDYGGGGTMAINTFLGGDGSPSDRLVISGGAATGSTTVHATNVGGPGVETTGDGILVVNAINGATTAPGAFVLASGELRAGAFDYDLFHGGVDGANPNSWFLRSDFIVPPVQPPVPPVVRPPEPIPPDPPPQPLPPGVYPIIGPELATYGVVQPLARQLGTTILGTLDDRMGDTYGPDCGGVVRPTSSFCGPSFWGRLIASSINNRYRAFADPRANGSLTGIQFGVDILRGSLIAGHSDRAGLYGAYGETDVGVDGLVTNPAATAYVLTRTGSTHLDALSGGAYWTHVGPGGWYLDTVLQGTSYSGSASTAFASLDTDGWGFLASLEGGAPFAVPQLGPGFVIEPQAQILWQEVSFGQRNDGLGDVSLGDTSGAMGRVGLRGRWTIVTGGGQVWQPYVRANLWQDWGPQANTTFGADIVGTSMHATLLQLGGGLTAKLDANFSLFANADYEFAVGDTNGDRRDSVRGALGVRYTW